MTKKMLSVIVFMLSLAVIYGWNAEALAQEAPAPAGTWWQPLVDMVLTTLLPALWAAIGPMATAAITKLVNISAAAYVPRPLQVVLSGLVTAVLAGLGSFDPAVAAVSGMAGQGLAMTPPKVLLTSAKE